LWKKSISILSKSLNPHAAAYPILRWSEFHFFQAGFDLIAMMQGKSRYQALSPLM
jgi:hypothetical protein